MTISDQVPALFGKQVVALFGSGGVNFTGRVVAYMAEPMYLIELPDGTKRWWAESLTKEAPTKRPFCGRPGCCGEEPPAISLNHSKESDLISDQARYRRVEE